MAALLLTSTLAQMGRGAEPSILGESASATTPVSNRYVQAAGQPKTPAPPITDPTEGAIPLESLQSDYACDDCENGWEFGGWIQQGISFNANESRDGFNGVSGLNDRDANYMLNQAWLYLAKETETNGCGWDIGGRVDAIFGTDAQFFQMVDGLEANWNQDDQFYQFALLRFYLDVAVDDWTFRFGKFDALVGYEPFEATENFFYSHSYAFNYGTPGTLFGMMATRDVTDQIAVNFGGHRGADQFDDTDGLNSMDFLAGISWTSCDEATWVDFQLIAEENGEGDNTFLYSVAAGANLTEKLEWVISYASGESTLLDSEWYGINQHFMYEICEGLSTGMRVEWFRDDDGAVVTGLRRGNLAAGPFVGNFYELTWAVNWEPRDNLALRPELRYDWYNADAAGGPSPFDAGNKNHQFLASFDVIVTF